MAPSGDARNYSDNVRTTSYIPDRRVNNKNNNKAMTRRQTDPTIAEGHRIYVGNLVYAAKKDDIIRLFTDHNFEPEKVDISVDPFTGRNPSYCFLEFASAVKAALAIHDMNGVRFLGRSLKLNKCTPPRRSAVRDDQQRAFDRYKQSDEAHEHWHAPAQEGRRAWVGGLPRARNQWASQQMISDFLQGYNVYEIP
jgi:RNA recognition motif-containing protein